MTRRSLAMLAILLLCLIGAVATTTASAAIPAILLLAAKAGLEASFTNQTKEGKAIHVFETVGKKALTSTTVTLTFKGCLELEGSKVDTNLCHEGLLTFTGLKLEAASCRTENELGEKDPIEVFLAKVDVHLADEKSTAKELVPLLVISLAGVKGEKEVIVNCAAVKVLVKGRVGCLMVPGLTQLVAFQEITIECEQKEGKQVTGTCEETKVLCEELANNPLEMKFGAAAFEKAALELNPSIKGSFPVDVFLDD
jgi:hypothetical protein